MDNLWTRLTSLPPADETFSVLAVLYLVVFAAGFIISVVLANQGSRRLARHPVTRRAIRHCATIGTYVFGAGIFFFGVRALNINPFSFGAPLWMWLSVIAVIIFALYCLRYWRTTYPVNLQAYAERQVKERYLRPAPAAHRRPAASSAARARAAGSDPTGRGKTAPR